MTEDEQKLLVFMLAQQQQRLLAVVEALKSKGILDADDLRAYEALLHEEKSTFLSSFANMAQQYEKFATALGLRVNLKD